MMQWSMLLKDKVAGIFLPLFSNKCDKGFPDICMGVHVIHKNTAFSSGSFKFHLMTFHVINK